MEKGYRFIKLSFHVGNRARVFGETPSTFQDWSFL
jgi:hypothetical protein